MAREVIHRCPMECKWKKNCFVCKTQGYPKEELVVLHKCVVTKEDIPVHLGRTENALCAS